MEDGLLVRLGLVVPVPVVLGRGVERLDLASETLNVRERDGRHHCLPWSKRIAARESARRPGTGARCTVVDLQFRELTDYQIRRSAANLVQQIVNLFELLLGHLARMYALDLPPEVVELASIRGGGQGKGRKLDGHDEV